MARRIPFEVLVAHSACRGRRPARRRQQPRRRRAAASKSCSRLAEPLGVTLALEVIPNELSRAGALVDFIEDDLERRASASAWTSATRTWTAIWSRPIETVSGHLITTHVHDNRGRTDDHLVPFDGTIDWPGALTAIQKVGYDGTLHVRDRRARLAEATCCSAHGRRAKRLEADCWSTDRFDTDDGRRST